MEIVNTEDFGTVAVLPVVIRKKQTIDLINPLYRPMTQRMSEARCGYGLTKPYKDQYIFFPAHAMVKWSHPAVGDCYVVKLDECIATGTLDPDEEAVKPEEVCPHFGRDVAWRG